MKWKRGTFFMAMRAEEGKAIRTEGLILGGTIGIPRGKYSLTHIESGASFGAIILKSHKATKELGEKLYPLVKRLTVEKICKSKEIMDIIEEMELYYHRY